MKKLILIFASLLILFNSYGKDKTVIAHRGASGYLPEHTLPSVAMAHAWGVDFIEADLVLTKDDQLVVLHDIHIDTTTNVAEVFPKRSRKDGRFYAVDFTLEEIKTLSVNERIDRKNKKKVFPKRFGLYKSKFSVPSFREFIELIQGLNKTTGRDIGIYPEIKAPEFHLKESKDITKITLDLLREYDYDRAEANIFVQCFFPPTLKRLRQELGAKFRLVALIAENSWKESSFNYKEFFSEKGMKRISSFVDGIGPYYKQLWSKPFFKRKLKVSKLVSLAKKNNLIIHPYTHRSDSLGKYFKNDGEFFDFIYGQAQVDGIFSDFGDRALKYSRN